MRKIILASQSPRRKELLSEIVSEYTIIPSFADETVPETVDTEDIVVYLALLKARDIAQSHKEDIVIGADTVVIVDEKVLNKPKDEDDAKRMLKLLSGRCHKVCTGCAFVCGEIEHSFSVETQVEFFELTDEEIDSYIKTGDCMDKAGAYGIQSQGKTLVKAIYGDYYNVVGLPVGRVKRELYDFVSGLEK